MSSILVAYATTEGQTAKITNALAQQLRAVGHTVDLVKLPYPKADLDFARYDAIIIAASVHAGKHQDSALRFVSQYADALRSRFTAFLSVSMAAVATEKPGLQRADEQVASFLEQVDWRPDLEENLGGAFHYSAFSRIKRWIFNLSQRIFKNELDRQGWPDLTVDQEFTDWDAVRRFGMRFVAGL